MDFWIAYVEDKGRPPQTPFQLQAYSKTIGNGKPLSFGEAKRIYKNHKKRQNEPRMKVDRVCLSLLLHYKQGKEVHKNKITAKESPSHNEKNIPK